MQYEINFELNGVQYKFIGQKAYSYLRLQDLNYRGLPSIEHAHCCSLLFEKIPEFREKYRREGYCWPAAENSKELDEQIKYMYELLAPSLEIKLKNLNVNEHNIQRILNLNKDANI